MQVFLPKKTQKISDDDPTNLDDNIITCFLMANEVLPSLRSDKQLCAGESRTKSANSLIIMVEQVSALPRIHNSSGSKGKTSSTTQGIFTKRCSIWLAYLLSRRRQE